MTDLFDNIGLLLDRGGVIMIPLLVLSIISLGLIIERAWFWAMLHSRRRLKQLRQLNDALRKGDRAMCDKLLRNDRSAYSDLARRLIKAGATEAVAVEATEMIRPRLDRFMVLLSTIITAAPLLGILGTVLGIIQSFRLLGEQGGALTDPRDVSAGIASALLTTAFGLVVALITLFPYMVFRGQVDRAVGRMESLIAAAQQGEASGEAQRAPGAPRRSMSAGESTSTSPAAAAAAAS